MEIKKPNFIIIGAAKCGTTTLAAILDQHSDVCMSNPKEVSFFQDTIDFKPNPNYEQGWEWYQKAFEHYQGEFMIGDATPSYTDRSRSPKTAQRIYEFNPDMKLIYMVRDPLKRQISGWKMQYTFSKILERKSKDWKIEYNWASEGFEFWMRNQQEAQQWDINRYDYQLKAYREFFNEDKIHVSFLEDWKQYQKEEVNRILFFLGLEPNLTDQAIFKRENIGDRKYDTFANIKLMLSSLGIHKVIPSSLKKQFGAKTIKEVIYPEIDFSSDIIQEFEDYIKADSEAFLKRYNKPVDFWNKK